jgi:ABC-type glycerol-3-phosphate transport system substrate-binding protein
MGSVVSVGLSRRALIRTLGAAAAGAAATPLLAACGPTAGTPQATAVPQAGPISGKFAIWFSANWNTVTDEAVGSIFVDWGKQHKPPIEVEWQSIPGSPQILAKESAAIAAGQPPEITNTNNIYWYSQGEKADVSATVAKFKDKAGGIPSVALASALAGDGKHFAAPYAIDPWPAHWRKDLIGKETGGKFFNTWEELIEAGPKIQQPPRTYLIAFALGHEGDHVNNLVTVLWSYGGRLADEKGVPDIKNPANRAGIETIVKIWKARLVPPDSFAQTVTSWNNETYQKGRALMAVNPATIYGWLAVNDKELAENTGLAVPPKGARGQFAEAGTPAFGMFKKAKLAPYAPAALEFFLQPENLQKVSSAVEGRYVPLYRDHLKTEFWQKSAFGDMKTIGEVGRIREWPAPPQAWLADVTDAKYTLSDMLSKIINENMAIEKAQEWAQAEMMDSYNKFKPK